MKADYRVVARTLILSALSLSFAASFAADTKGVAITQEQGKLRIQVQGKPFTEYVFEGTSRPYFYPILNADGLAMSRQWPMEKGEGEEHDHPHHRSLWWAHGEMNGEDFWSESNKAGKTVHKGFLEVSSGANGGTIRSTNAYVALSGKTVATDTRTMRIPNRSKDRVLDFEVTLYASEGDLVLGDTKEGTMAIRLAETMRLVRDKKPGAGHIVNSEGVKDADTWGKRAKWCDYYGPVQGKTVGVAVFDHPSNPSYPTWWHVRDYGLFAANPFGVHDFEKKPAKAGEITVPAGKSITFRYRFLFHTGDQNEGKVAEEFDRWIQPSR